MDPGTTATPTRRGLTNAIARGARNMGARIVRHNRVIDINPLPSGEWEVVTENGVIVAESVVNAAGCYARQVAQMVGADLPICNIQHHYLVSGPIQEFIDREEEIPVMRDPYSSAYLRQEQEIGGSSAFTSTPTWPKPGRRGACRNGRPTVNSLTMTSTRLMPWLKRALERMPIIQNSGIKRIVNGAIPHSADGPPLLGPVAGLKNFWLCCGSSFGIAQGAGCGKYLAQWMLHGDAEINMTGFDPRRFGAFADESYMKDKGRQDYSMTYFTPLPRRRTARGAPAAHQSAVRKTRGAGLRLYRDLRLGTAQVVLPRRPRRGIRLPAQQRVRRGAE